VISVPLGAYVIKNGDARFVPSYDVTVLSILGVGMVKSVFKRRRRRR
jgi:hypothetical protein